MRQLRMRQLAFLLPSSFNAAISSSRGLTSDVTDRVDISGSRCAIIKNENDATKMSSIALSALTVIVDVLIR